MRLAILLFTFLISLNCCSQQEPINEKYVSRHLTYLASDELRGRRAFSPEISQAEDYIAAEFAGAGLSPFLGNDNYLQEFKLLELTVTSKQLTINGEAID